MMCMDSPQHFYITTTLPYVNAEPHIGFALEIVAADVIARTQRILGNTVTFNTGTDEHGQKIYQKAHENQQTPQEYVDHYAAKFDELKNLLNLSYDRFIRTTNPSHKQAAQDFWQRCYDNGDIYKKMYKVKYCVGCELEKTDSELVDDTCPLHPNRDLEIREEENYFFQFSKYQQPLLDLYSADPRFVEPATKMKEIQAFVAAGLQDFSISRLKSKMPWGVAVPNDPEHVMYVWFDALINYISTLGWPDESTTRDYQQFWPGVQIAGKDNLRQQSAMWQAMLLSAGLPPSKKILINGFISVDGQKMSKSLGNVISPTQLVERYGKDGARFLLSFIGPIGDDMDVSWEKFDTAYTAHLSNGIGNLCSRVAKMCEKANIHLAEADQPSSLSKAMIESLSAFQIQDGLHSILKSVSELDQFLSKEKPWKLEGEAQKEVLEKAAQVILQLARDCQPFLPETAEKIYDHFSAPHIAALEPLFPRLK